MSARSLLWVERMQDVVADLYSALQSGTDVNGSLIASDDDGTFLNPGLVSCL